MGVQIQRTLSNDFGIELSPTAVYSHPTVTALAAHIRELTQPVEKTAPADASTTPSTAPEEPIAIVGMACRFPRGETIDEFWTTLSTGRDAISHVPSNVGTPTASLIPTRPPLVPSAPIAADS